MFENTIRDVGERPADTAAQSEKKRYGELISAAVAQQVAADLRARGLDGCLPNPQGGAERVFAGGIGTKKVDVSWATEEGGLLFGLFIKTINFPDGRTGNYQKNLSNRRGDMLFESVTLHRRFPYAVLGGLLLLHEGANADETDRRGSTFINAHERFRIFTGRSDPGDREEKYERIYIGLYESIPPYSVRLWEAGDPNAQLTWDSACEALLRTVADRNPDQMFHRNGRLIRR